MKLLETSHLVDHENGRQSATSSFDETVDEPLTSSTISMFELAFGAVWDGRRDLADLRESLTWVEFLDLSVEDAFEGARNHAELQDAVNRIPIPDVMIAGVARRRGATPVAADAHFGDIDGHSVDRHRLE